MSRRSQSSYDVVAVGTGFATSFFLREYLDRAPAGVKVLVLEAGGRVSHAEQARMAREDGRYLLDERSDHFTNRTPGKPWNFTRAFGGGSNCWFGQTPRMLPEDFALHSRYGVGVDWPVSYDELEEFYSQAESILQVSGPGDRMPYPMSRPYPQPPHRFGDPDRVLERAYPGQFFHMPTARARVATVSGRPACCNNAVCHVCPINAKFTILQDMRDVYEDERVTLTLGAEARRLEHAGGVARAVEYRTARGDARARGDLIVLGANALFNPYILLRSALDHPELGRGLGEQTGVWVRVDLDGLENFQGSTISTGIGFMRASGEHRRERAAMLLFSENSPTGLRHERGKWRQVLHLLAVFEDLRQPRNRVEVGRPSSPGPDVFYEGRSDYTQRAVDRLGDDLEEVLAPLPVERVVIEQPRHTESHIQGTTVMGDDPATSVVDGFGLHHELRNLLVLGSGTFPTAAPANPTLTLSALALRAAQHVT